jgi:hypothetical protein
VVPALFCLVTLTADAAKAVTLMSVRSDIGDTQQLDAKWLAVLISQLRCNAPSLLAQRTTMIARLRRPQLACRPSDVAKPPKPE